MRINVLIRNSLILYMSLILIILLPAEVSSKSLAEPLHQVQIAQVTDVKETSNTWAHPGGRYYIRHPDGFYMCTVGFPATDNSGKHYFLTAGHCGEPGDSVYRAVYQEKDDDPIEDLFGSNHYETQLTKIGSFRAKISLNARGQTIDIAMVQMAPSAFIPGGADNLPINIMPPAVGMQICKLGISSGRTCGVILKRNQLIHPSNYKAGLIGDRTDMCVISGDSGGPVTSANSAVGIVSAGAESDTCNRRGGGNSLSFISDLSMGLKILKSTYPSLRLV